jgi:hypothetical protein
MLTALPPQPAAPVAAITQANATTQTIEVTFTPDPEVADGGLTIYYVIEHSTSVDPTWIRETTFVPEADAIPAYTLLYVAPVLKLGVSHNFRVIAVNGLGNSNASAVTSVRVVNPPPRPVITNLFVTIGKSMFASATLTWRGSDLAGGYQVEYTLASQTNWQVVGTTKTTRNVVANLVIGQQYLFRVYPYVSANSTGAPVDFGIPSEVYSQYIGVAPYDDVTVLQPVIVGQTNTTISMIWSRAATTGLPVQYNLYYSVFDPLSDITVPAVTLLVANISGNTYTLTSFLQKKYYQFGIAAVNDLGAGAVSLLSSQVYTGDPPKAPYAVKIGSFVQLDDGSVATDVSWNTSGDALSYVLEFTSDNIDWQSLRTSTLFASVSGLPLGGVLVVRVLALNGRGNSDYSPNATASIQLTPGAMLRPKVYNYTVNGPNTAVLVGWQQVKWGGTDINYKLEHSITSLSIEQTGAYSWLTDVATFLGLSYTITLPTASMVVFRTTASNSGGTGIPSAPSIPVTLAGVPSSPNGLTYYVKESYPLGVSVAFTPSEANGAAILYFYAEYTISPADPSKSGDPVTGTVMIPAGNSTVNASIPAYNGWNYNVAVYAVNAMGNSKPANLSFVLAVKPRLAPTAPDFGVVTIEPGHIADFSMEWTVDYTDTGVDSFVVETSLDNTKWNFLGTIRVGNDSAGNGSCSYVPFSTVISCVGFISVPSGYTYYVRLTAANSFGQSPAGPSNTIIAAVRPAFAADFAVNFTAIDLGNMENCDANIMWSKISDDGGNLQVWFDIEYTLDVLLNGPYVLVNTTLASFINMTAIPLGNMYFFRFTPHGLGGRGSPFFARFTPSVSPSPIGNLTITDVGDLSMRVEFDIPWNGGIYLWSFTVTTYKEDLRGRGTTYNATYASGYVDLRPNNRYSLLIPVVRGYFYNFSVISTNANMQIAKAFSPPSKSYFAAYYILRNLNPNYNTVQGGARTSMVGDTVPWTPRFICRFGDIDTKAMPTDYVHLETASPLCPVPPRSNTGAVNIYISLDGNAWSDRTIIFTYYGFPNVTKTTPRAGTTAGKTPVTMTGLNIQYTQYVTCKFGENGAVAEARYMKHNTMLQCFAPLSKKISPPKVPVYVSIDYNPYIKLIDFFYYITPTLTSVSQTVFDDDAPGKYFEISGSTFYETGEPPKLQFYHTTYLSVYAAAVYKDAGTMSARLPALPGAGTQSWTISISFDGGLTYTNTLPISVKSVSAANCKTRDCASCLVTPGCNYTKAGTYGIGWCHSYWQDSIDDQFRPMPASNCSGFYFTNAIRATPQDLFKSDPTITYILSIQHFIHTHAPLTVGPQELITCQGGGKWMSITDDRVFKNSGGSSFTPFQNYMGTAYFLCYFSLPLETPLYETQNIGFNYELIDTEEFFTYTADYTLKPYAQIRYTTENQLEPRIIHTKEFDKEPEVVISVVGTDFLTKTEWFDGNLVTPSKTCNEACDYTLHTLTMPNGVYTITLILNGQFKEDTKGYTIFDNPEFVRSLEEFGESLGKRRRAPYPRTNMSSLLDEDWLLETAQSTWTKE